MRVASQAAEPIFIAIVVLWFLIGWWRGRPAERQGAITALLAAGGSLAANQLIAHLWFRARPFAAHPGAVHLLLAHSADASFPSDHTAAAFAIALVLLGWHRRAGGLALAFGVLLGYARVYVGDHYPGDVIAGAIVGIVIAGVLLTWLEPLAAWLGQVVSRLMLALRLPLPDAPSEQGSA